MKQQLNSNGKAGLREPLAGASRVGVGHNEVPHLLRNNQNENKYITHLPATCVCLVSARSFQGSFD